MTTGSLPAAQTPFGDRLRRHRRLAGFSQEELAERAELSVRGLAYLEQGQRLPHPATLRRLVEALGLQGEERDVFLQAGALAGDGSLPPSNLPQRLTSFVGRAHELTAIHRLLSIHRLVTITGAGGCGKTRLALEASDALRSSYPHGVWLIALAPLADPVLVLATIAQVLEVREQSNEPLLDTLLSFLGSKQLLLILDNCEHLLGACAGLADTLLRRCPGVRLLATSREGLGIPGEQAWPLSPLAVPEESVERDPAVVTAAEAVQLFVNRAQARRSDFAVTIANVAPVATLCRRLDGIPLALELAAARVGSLPLPTLVERLDDRFTLLAEHDGPSVPHHVSLRAAIDWSYRLLSEPEQALLARTSVFAGGWTVDAAEAICSGDPLPSDRMLGLLASLVSASLVVLDDGRYSLLESIRQYAGDRLGECGEADEMRSRHAAHFFQLATIAEPELRGPNQRRWLGRLEEEQDNLRTALGRLLDQGQPEEELRLATALSHFWHISGYVTEGLGWLEAGLNVAEGVTPQVQARALERSGVFLLEKGELGRAIALAEQSHAAFRELGDEVGSAIALHTLSSPIYLQGDVERAIQCGEESLALFRRLQHRTGIVDTLLSLGIIACDGGQFATAEARYREALTLAREIGDSFTVATSLNNLGFALMEQARFDEAAAALEESLTLARELGMKPYIAPFLDSLACVAVEQGEYDRAGALFAEGLTLSHEMGITWVALYILGHMAELAAKQGKVERAVRLGGAEAAARQERGMFIVPVEQEHREQALRRARVKLGEESFHQAWTEGQAMSLEEAVAFALGESQDKSFSASLSSAGRQ